MSSTNTLDTIIPSTLTLSTSTRTRTLYNKPIPPLPLFALLLNSDLSIPIHFISCSLASSLISSSSSLLLIQVSVIPNTSIVFSFIISITSTNLIRSFLSFLHNPFALIIPIRMMFCGVHRHTSLGSFCTLTFASTLLLRLLLLRLLL